MTDFFRKLNLLLRTSLPDLLPESGPSSTPPRLGKQIDREIAALNDRVTDAFRYEAQLKARIAGLEQTIFALDEEADRAMADGFQEQSRYHIERMKREQARLEMTRADLSEHQRVTAELVQRVRELEHAVQRAREAKQAEVDDHARPSVDESLRTLREQTGAAPDLSMPEEPRATPSKPRTGDDELDQRIQRLSK